MQYAQELIFIITITLCLVYLALVYGRNRMRFIKPKLIDTSILISIGYEFKRTADLSDILSLSLTSISVVPRRKQRKNRLPVLTVTGI